MSNESGARMSLDLRLASRLVATSVMSARLGPVYCDHEAEHPFLCQRVALDGGTSAGMSALACRSARE